MSKYYVVRLGSDFTVIYMDPQAAERWSKAGWELRKYESNDEAQLAMAEWEANSKKRTLFLVRRQA
jgi:hypothetical protein